MKVLKVNYSKKLPAIGLLILVPLVGVVAYFSMCNEDAFRFVSAFAAVMFVNLAIELIRGWRRIIVNDECVEIKSRYKWTVCFRDVEDFYPLTYKGQYLIGIHYKQEHENYRTDEYLDETRETRMGYKLSPGAPYEIPTRYLDIKPQELLKQLNERLHLQKITSRTE
ncbi:hypothetical protein PRMUPPPA20_11400 [Xylanibacter ruminicola]|uniref:Uncharacterized protein n=2 Tax=Xylanibacter ruminicola TaxID=839 RepID=D5EYE5_XYLR2|nr:STM3941 family protein [Xylanibacter ruminicola]ADE83601.1 hypothetical protein PRU_0626 [Xylanibacter ruminicola 23]GJG33031.1 hypothetical protein PRMUPPPA20_11400 [Xylanibacter ruminicola]SEI00761.1 hypothetical protein SAMN02745192_2873 [Xylanibacter ruminicola]